MLSEDFDAACQAHGLRDMRDALVLAVAGDGTPRTQIEIATTLGLDKSTLMSIIDRLVEDGLMVREVDPANRRIRLPRTTDAGQVVLNRTLAAREEAVDATLAGFAADEITHLRTLLWRIATARRLSSAQQRRGSFELEAQQRVLGDFRYRRVDGRR